jgi:hypothetical protein
MAAKAAMTGRAQEIERAIGLDLGVTRVQMCRHPSRRGRKYQAKAQVNLAPVWLAKQGDCGTAADPYRSCSADIRGRSRKVVMIQSINHPHVEAKGVAVAASPVEAAFRPLPRADRSEFKTRT